MKRRGTKRCVTFAYFGVSLGRGGGGYSLVTQKGKEPPVYRLLHNHH